MSRGQDVVWRDQATSAKRAIVGRVVRPDGDLRFVGFTPVKAIGWEWGIIKEKTCRSSNITNGYD